MIKFKNVDAGYTLDPTLKDINLHIKKGEHLAILGGNGSGKSTLLKLIACELYPRKSKTHHCSIFGQERWNIWELKKKLGVITNDLHGKLTHGIEPLSGWDIVLSGFYGSMGCFDKCQEYSSEQYEQARKIIIELGLDKLVDRPLRTLSMGEVRKFIIARALVHHPEALLLDEPTVGLDVKAQQEFIELLRKLSKEMTIILVTHHIEEIFEEISHVLLIKNGKILKQGKKVDMMRNKLLSKLFEIDITVEAKKGRYALSLNR
jgi:iron complex transport system ATP-binding protein